LCPWPIAGFAGWLFPFQGRSLASALAGPAVLNAGGDKPAQRCITGDLVVAIGVPFTLSIVFNKMSSKPRLLISQYRRSLALIIQKIIGFSRMGHPKGVAQPETGTDSALATGTEMGTAPGEQDAADGGSAAAAGLAGTQVDAVLKLEESAGASRVDVIGDRGAAQPNGLLENLAQSPAQALELGAGETAGGAARTDSGMKEALVGVDVAHSGEQGLVEKRCLDGELSTAKEGREFVGADGKRLSAGRGEGTGAGEVAEVQFTEFEAAEAARVDEAEFAAAQKTETSVSMRGHRFVRGSHEQAAGHAEVNDPLSIWLRVGIGLRGWGGVGRRGGAQLADDVLARPVNREDDAAGEALCLARARSFEGLGVGAEPRLDDAVAAQAFVYSAGDGFNFGQFGHRFILMERGMQAGLMRKGALPARRE